MLWTNGIQMKNRKFSGFQLYGVTFGTLAFMSFAFLKWKRQRLKKARVSSLVHKKLLWNFLRFINARIPWRGYEGARFIFLPCHFKYQNNLFFKRLISLFSFYLKGSECDFLHSKIRNSTNLAQLTYLRSQITDDNKSKY